MILLIEKTEPKPGMSRPSFCGRCNVRIPSSPGPGALGGTALQDEFEDQSPQKAKVKAALTVWKLVELSL